MLCTCSTMKSRSDSTLWITNSAGLSGKKSDPQSFAWAAAFRRLCSHLLTNRAVCDLTDAMGKLLNGENSGISHLVRAAPAGAEDRQKPLTPIRLTRPEARKATRLLPPIQILQDEERGGQVMEALLTAIARCGLTQGLQRS